MAPKNGQDFVRRFDLLCFQILFFPIGKSPVSNRLGPNIWAKVWLQISNYVISSFQPTCKVPPLGPHPVQKCSDNPKLCVVFQKIWVSLPSVCFQEFCPRGTKTAVFSDDFGPRGTNLLYFPMILVLMEAKLLCFPGISVWCGTNRNKAPKKYIFRNVIICLLFDSWPKQKVWVSNNFGGNGKNYFLPKAGILLQMHRDTFQKYRDLGSIEFPELSPRRISTSRPQVPVLVLDAEARSLILRPVVLDSIPVDRCSLRYALMNQASNQGVLVALHSWPQIASELGHSFTRNSQAPPKREWNVWLTAANSNRNRPQLKPNPPLCFSNLRWPESQN